MKKTYLVLILAWLILELIGAFTRVKAQSWEWSKKMTQPYSARIAGMMADKDGNVYSYGSLNYPTYESPYGWWGSSLSTDTIGSFLQCYTGTGELKYSKRWPMPMHINRMDYDGDNAFYFAGIFSGTITIDGITLTGKGRIDGVTGKMDLNGNVLWMHSVGGPKTEGMLSISFNAHDGTVYSSGAMSDTLYIDNNLVSVTQQSAIIANYSPDGTLIRYKLYDFVPDSDAIYFNVATEITGDMSGNLFVLMDREGKGWSTYDTVPGVAEGRYVMKLDDELDTLWSSFVINMGCYYGWSCGALRVSENGDAYVAAKCESHYGGTAFILRMAGNTGTITWSHTNDDGFYSDMYIKNKTVYVIGIEGANACPCESNDRGYGVIKILDAANNFSGEMRTTNTELTSVLKNDAGIYISGNFGESQFVAGPDTMIADSTAHLDHYHYNGRFLSKLSGTPCQPVDITVTGMPSLYGHRYYLGCPGDTATLTASGSGTFTWSNGDTGPASHVWTGGDYFVINHQQGSCQAYSLPSHIALIQSNPPGFMAACFDSVSWKNKILFTADWDEMFGSYNIYKETSPGNFSWLHSMTYSSYIMQYVDSASSPSSVTDRYALTHTDTCGNESSMTSIFKTMLLTVNHEGPRNVLRWNLFEGFPFDRHYIYRGTSPYQLWLIDSVDAPVTEYGDNNFNSTLYYQVRVKKMNSPYPNMLKGQLRSNIATVNFNAAERPVTENIFSISPNPTHGTFLISAAMEAELKIYNPVGEIVYHQSISSANQQIDLSKEPKGIYIVEGGNERRKIVLN